MQTRAYALCRNQYFLLGLLDFIPPTPTLSTSSPLLTNHISILLLCCCKHLSFTVFIIEPLSFLLPSISFSPPPPPLLRPPPPFLLLLILLLQAHVLLRKIDW